MATLFDPMTIGKLTLPNRIIMAPLTRSRAGDSRLPNQLMADYYGQRASAGLIISEATAISEEAYGWKDAPGVYTEEQEAAWRGVTDAVHDKGGRIFLQLWHMGRVSHPQFQPGGAAPLAPSAIKADGIARSLGKDVPYVTPRAMTKDDINRTLEDYAMATARALRAGFDGVEIHGANGYLIDQFLRDGSNKRDDEYGGSVEGRAQFLREVIEAVVAVAGSERAGLRLSPVNGYNDMHDSDLHNTFVKIAQMVDKHGIAYLHVKEPSRDEQGRATGSPITAAMRKVYKGPLIVNESYDGASAAAAISGGLTDAVAFGKDFIANPDLVERLHAGAKLNALHMETLYSGGPEGYTDYPFMKAHAA